MSVNIYKVKSKTHTERTNERARGRCVCAPFALLHALNAIACAMCMSQDSIHYRCECVYALLWPHFPRTKRNFSPSHRLNEWVSVCLCVCVCCSSLHHMLFRSVGCPMLLCGRALPLPLYTQTSTAFSHSPIVGTMTLFTTLCFIHSPSTQNNNNNNQNQMLCTTFGLHRIGVLRERIVLCLSTYRRTHAAFRGKLERTRAKAKRTTTTAKPNWKIRWQSAHDAYTRHNTTQYLSIASMYIYIRSHIPILYKIHTKKKFHMKIGKVLSLWLDSPNAQGLHFPSNAANAIR